MFIFYIQGSIAWPLENVRYPYSWNLSPGPQALIPDLNVNKQRNSNRATHFTEIIYLKQRHTDMMSLVFKKQNLCPVMPASWGGNSLTTSHTVEHLSSIHKDRQTHIWTNWLLESIGPEGRCFENKHSLEHLIKKNLKGIITGGKNLIYFGLMSEM